MRRTIRKIKKILKWIPTLWYDEDWDYYFIYSILQKKLEFTRDHIKKNGYHLDSNHVASRIQTAIDLIEAVKTEKYIDLFIEEREVESFTEAQLLKSLKKHDKARNLLFKFLNHNLPHWWD
jgi:hypothetical protein